MTSVFPLEPPPGFQGFSPHDEVQIYGRHLPHWRQKGASYFITFRLADSLPQIKAETIKQQIENRRKELSAREKESKKCSHETQKTLAKFIFEATENILDQNLGDCILREHSTRAILAETLHKDAGIKYELGTYVLMPNHVHWYSGHCKISNYQK